MSAIGRDDSGDVETALGRRCATVREVLGDFRGGEEVATIPPLRRRVRAFGRDDNAESEPI